MHYKGGLHHRRHIMVKMIITTVNINTSSWNIYYKHFKSSVIYFQIIEKFSVILTKVYFEKLSYIQKPICCCQLIQSTCQSSQKILYKLRHAGDLNRITTLQDGRHTSFTVGLFFRPRPEILTYKTQNTSPFYIWTRKYVSLGSIHSLSSNICLRLSIGWEFVHFLFWFVSQAWQSGALCATATRIPNAARKPYQKNTRRTAQIKSTDPSTWCAEK